MNLNLIFEIIRFLIILSILVFVHELGHYLVARLMGIKVVEFGLGFPPRVLSKKYKGTIYSLNALPIGGFVRLYGEDSSVDKDRGHAYYHKGKLARSAVIISGVIMNFLLAVLLFASITWTTGVYETGFVKIREIVEDSPAQKAKLQAGDVVVKVAGKNVHRFYELTKLITENKDRETAFVINRNGQTIDTVITPQSSPQSDNKAIIGVLGGSLEFRDVPLIQRPFTSLNDGFNESVFMVQLTFDSVTTTISQVFNGHGAGELSGPVGIYKVTNEAAEFGILSLMNLVALISVNLAVLNIMPFPALDGGRLFFIIYEFIIGRKPNEKFEGYLHFVGIILLLTLMLAITFFNDLHGVDMVKNLFGQFDRFIK